MSRPADRRSRSNRNDRGSSYSRRRRREWLVEQFGDGLFVACFLQSSPYCLYVLDVDNVSADRLRLGVDGGSYRRGNIRPSCGPCQADQGGEVGQQRKAALAAARLAQDPSACDTARTSGSTRPVVDTHPPCGLLF